MFTCGLSSNRPIGSDLYYMYRLIGTVPQTMKVVVQIVNEEALQASLSEAGRAFGYRLRPLSMTTRETSSPSCVPHNHVEVSSNNLETRHLFTLLFSWGCSTELDCYGVQGAQGTQKVLVMPEVNGARQTITKIISFVNINMFDGDQTQEQVSNNLNLPDSETTHCSPVL